MKTRKLLTAVISILAFVATNMQAQVPSYVPTNGLVGYWGFNGNANDQSGNGNNGTVNGATLTTDRNGNANSAYSFDGVSNHISLNNSICNFGINDFTLSAWILKNSLIAGSVIGKRNSGADGNMLILGSSPSYEISSGSGDYFANNTTPSYSALNTWFHIVLVRSGNSLKSYTNGQLVDDYISPTIHNINNSAITEIGARYSESSLWNLWIGKVDDVAIYNRALTQSEITQLYSSTSNIQNLCTKTIQPYNVNVGDATHEGSTYAWSISPEAPNAIINGNGTNTITIDWTNVPNDSYTLQAIETSATGCVSTVVSATINLLATPAPIAQPQTFCANATVANLNATGTDIKWYASANDGAALPSTTALTTGSYYVSQTINGCESIRTLILVTITPQPTAPILTCGQTASFDSTSCSWVVTSPPSTHSIWADDFNSYNDGVLATDINGFSAGQGGWYIWGAAANNWEIVSNTLSANTSDKVLKATGTNTDGYAWTDNLANSTDVSSGNYETITLKYRYYLGGANSNSRNRFGIEMYDISFSKTLAGAFIQNDTGQFYIVSNYNSFGTINNYFFTTGNEGILPRNNWYNIIVTYNKTTGRVTGGFATDANALINNYKTFSVNGAAAGSIAGEVDIISRPNYSQTTAVGYFDNIIVDITNNSSTITTSPIAQPQTFCANATVANLVATGTNLQWYSVATGGTALDSGTPLASGIYYVSNNLGTCESQRTAVAITINSTVTPTFTQVASTCSGTAIMALPTTSNNGITGTWSPAINNSETTTYTFTPDASQCAAPTTQTITITTPKITSRISFVAPVASLPNVTIGSQVWTNKNLDVATYRDGTPIPQVTDPTEWSNLTSGAWCYYNNDPANGAIYGKLYNWYAVAGIYDADSLNDPSLRKQLAPIGWHVPSDSEWTTLTGFLGGEGIAGGKMKEIGTSYWNSPNVEATNESGFTAYGGGFRVNNGINYYMGNVSLLWSSTEIDSSWAWPRVLNYSNGSILREGNSKGLGLSVRLIKD